MNKTLAALALCVFAYLPAANATVITFDQFTGPPQFDGNVNSPLTIDIATFTGGELLTNETNSNDLTTVYATTNLVTGAYTNPLVITFSKPVSGFSIDVVNELADNYTVADNVGDSETMFVPATTTQLFSLAGKGITSVTIVSGTLDLWDFAIDNVTYTAQTTGTPEPYMFLPVAAGLIGLGLFRRRRVN